MKEKFSKLISSKEFKQVKRIMNKNKPIVFLLAIMLLSTVGGTIAYYYSQHVQENNFNLADYNITLEEYFPDDEWDEDDILDKQVKITNNGNSDVLLRIAYNEIWYNNDEILNNMYEGVAIVDKHWTDAFLNDFVYSGGWYYYNKVLKKGESVEILESVEKVVGVYNGSNYQYQLDINYEVLQADNGAAEKVWGTEATIEGSNVVWGL